jgi:hypothetical protein
MKRIEDTKEYKLGFDDAVRGYKMIVPESNGEEYAKGYNYGRMYVMRKYSPVSDDIYLSEKKSF